MTDKCEVPNLAAETCKTFLPNFHLENGKPLPKIPPPEDETPEHCDNPEDEAAHMRSGPKNEREDSMGTDSEFSTQKPTSLKRTNTISMSKEAAEMKRRTVPALQQQMQPQVTSEQQHNQTRKANVISKDPPRGHYSIPDRYIPPHSSLERAREEEPPKASRRHRVKAIGKKVYDNYAQEDSYQQLRRENAEALEKCNQYTHMINELRQHIAASEQVVERNELSTKQIQAELENKEFFLERQETDTDIIRQFETLLSAIKTWSNHVVGGKDLDAKLKESQGGGFLHVAPSYLPIAFGELEKAIAKDRKKRRHFVRGLAAFKMSLLFRTPDDDSKQPTSQLDPWLDEHLAKSFSDLENRLQSAGSTVISKRKVHDWRALTAELLSKTSGQGSQSKATQEHLRNMVKDVMSVVAPWTNHPCEGGQTLDNLSDQLFMTYLDAVNFSQLLRRQRACWSVKFPKRVPAALEDGVADFGNLRVDPGSMAGVLDEDEDRDPEKLGRQFVEIVVTPALWKRGNMAGEQFETEHTFVKAVVVIFQAEE
ncbi:hypothetical protein Vi05172_g9926 [Venturia inaequalis]|nr:hypothetical protein Vi05172_g9926 [Venturia inaequalis]